MPDMRALKTQDRKARAFIDGVGAGPVCIGYMPPVFAAQTSAALWLAEEGARAIRKMERKVIYRKAGLELATDIAQAKWRMEKDGVAVAVTDYFAHTFTATPDGWRLSECRMLWTVRVRLQAYLRIFGDFSHSPRRGILPDFYLRDLTQEEIKESGLRDGAVLSVSSLVVKKLGRTLKARKREKQMQALLDSWSERGGTLSGEPETDAVKNARVIKQGKKNG